MLVFQPLKERGADLPVYLSAKEYNSFIDNDLTVAPKTYQNLAKLSVSSAVRHEFLRSFCHKRGNRENIPPLPSIPANRYFHGY